MGKYVMLLSNQQEFVTRLTGELGKLLGSDWTFGSFSDVETMRAWCGGHPTLILFEGGFRRELGEHFEEGLLYVPLLEERPSELRTRFVEEGVLWAEPGVFLYQRAEGIAQEIQDMWTLWEMRRNRCVLARRKQLETQESGDSVGMEEAMTVEPCASECEGCGEISDEISEEITNGSCDADSFGTEGEHFSHRPKLIAFSSPCGGCGVTSLAAAFAGEMGRKMRTVLVSFDLYPGVIGRGRELSEVLYLIREYGSEWAERAEVWSRPLRTRLLGDLGRDELWSGARVISGLAGPEDLWEWNDTAWELFFTGLGKCGVEAVVVDFGAGIMAQQKLFRAADRWIVVGESGNEKVKQWLATLGEEAKKAELVSMAELPGKSARRPSPEQKAVELLVC